MSWIKMPTMADRTCPGIREFTRPTVRYVKCHVCGGNVEKAFALTAELNG
jgi:hypothetical protein